MLKDPSSTRVVSTLPLPPQRPLDSSCLYTQYGINWLQIIKFLQLQGRLQLKDFKQLILSTCQILKNEPNLIVIDDPITIVGDIHGQFYDLINILRKNCGGMPENTKYLFLGDYVDRGSFSIQVLITLFSLKISYPKSIILLRGNHQCRQLTSYFNFKTQCITKYSQQIYSLIMDLFDCLPLACLINGKFLCIHGGISHQLQNLRDIMKINRFQEIKKTGLLCDLLWADPVDNQKGKTEKIIQFNDFRGCSYFFGYELCRNFMKKNKVVSIIRAHEAQLQGYKLNKWDGSEKFPTVITVFSAPNYCDFYNNKGAIIKLQNGVLNIQQYYYSQHPYILPNFMDLFQWSIPFVSEKVSEILYHVIKPSDDYQQEQLEQSCKSLMQCQQFINRRKIIQMIWSQQKQKIAKNLQMMNVHGFCPDSRILQSCQYNRDLNLSFQNKKLIDLKNQHFPQSQQIGTI